MSLEESKFSRFVTKYIPGIGIVSDIGDTKPTDGTAGYAPGCIFQKTDGSADACFYINQGTLASCNFDPIDVGELTGSNVTVADADGYFAGSDVEAVLAEIGTQIRTQLMTNPVLIESSGTANEMACSAFDYKIAGVMYHKAADTDFPFTGTEVILKNKFGGFLLSIDASGTLKTTPCPDVADSKQDYADKAAVEAALADVPADECPIGYLVIQATADTDFTAQSTDLAAQQSATFYVDDAIFEGLM